MNGLLRTFRTLRYLRPSQIFWRLWYRARRPWFAGARYAAGLVPKAPTLPNRHPDAEVWPGDAENGRRMIETETIRLLDQDQRFDIPDPWHPEEKSHLWRFTINYFDWLADLAATRDPRGLVLARDLVTRWIDAHPRPDAEAWHPYPLSLRLVAWMRHAPWLLDGAEAGFRDRFLASLHAQANHLPRVLEKDVGGNHLIKNLKALIVVGHGLPGHGQRLKPALARLEKECRRQILADGAHYERSPAYHVQVLCDLLDLHLMLADPPSWLTGAIKAMSAAYVTMRHGDGRLALFNDGTEGDEPLLVALDRLLAPLPAPRDRLPDMGLERLSEGADPGAARRRALLSRRPARPRPRRYLVVRAVRRAPADRRQLRHLCLSGRHLASSPAGHRGPFDGRHRRSRLGRGLRRLPRRPPSAQGGGGALRQPGDGAPRRLPPPRHRPRAAGRGAGVFRPGHRRGPAERPAAGAGGAGAVPPASRSEGADGRRRGADHLARRRPLAVRLFRRQRSGWRTASTPRASTSCCRPIRSSSRRWPSAPIWPCRGRSNGCSGGVAARNTVRGPILRHTPSGGCSG